MLVAYWGTITTVGGLGMKPNTLGQRMREQRKSHKMTSEQLAELCGVGAVHIRKIESGAKVPSLNLFIRLCNALDVSPEYLLQDELKSSRWQ